MACCCWKSFVQRTKDGFVCRVFVDEVESVLVAVEVEVAVAVVVAHSPIPVKQHSRCRTWLQCKIQPGKEKKLGHPHCYNA